MKLRVNGILNGMEKRGLLFANTAAAGGIINLLLHNTAHNLIILIE